VIGDKGYGKPPAKGGKRRPKAPSSPPATGFDVRQFTRACAEVLELLQDLPERAEDFADSATETVLGMLETAEGGKITARMRDALANTRAAAERWKGNR